jgi:hypothetical protein
LADSLEELKQFERLKGYLVLPSSIVAIPPERHSRCRDYDIPAPPPLATITRYGRKIEVVAQSTKTGHLRVFERKTGNSVFGVSRAKR